MIVPSVYTLSKLSENEFFEYLNSVYSRREEAVIKQKLNVYCSRIGIPPTGMIQEFFEKSTEQEALGTCRATNASNRHKCERKVKAGTNYCGYHKRFHNPVQTRRAPVRPEPTTTQTQINGFIAPY